MPGHSSSSLRGAENVRRPRHDWARSEVSPADLPNRRQMSAAAVADPVAPRTRARLEALGAQRASGHWEPWEQELRDKGAAIRRETLGDLEGYLTKLTTVLSARGVHVHRAPDAPSAREIITQIAHDHQISTIVKSKSMATEEIGLGHHLDTEGIDSVETDLGEYIVQIAGERPSHIVGPALHLSREEIRQRLSQANGDDLADTTEAMAGFARQRLREDFKAARMGVCGVNFAAADTGTLVLVSNEGNVDMVTTQTDVLVAVMSIEKVIPRLADIGVLVPLLSNTANKEFVTAYQTLINGPRQPGETDGPQELHLVIVDNGRSQLLGTETEPILACIRCGNCQFSCPVFRTMGGGHAYGAVYGGPIGSVLSRRLLSSENAGDMAFLCSLCGACTQACPVEIPLADLLVTSRIDHEKHHGRGQRIIWGLWAGLWSRPRLYRATRGAARIVGKLIPPGLLARVPIASLWATGRSMPDLRQAGALWSTDDQEQS